MKIQRVNNTSFGTRFTTGYNAYRNKKLENYLEKGIDLFQKQTKGKPGCLTLRSLDDYVWDYNETFKDKYFFWGCHQAPHRSGGYQGVLKYDQRAMTDKNFLKEMIVEKTPQEQADILEAIFDTLQIIPKKIQKENKQNIEYMKDLANKVNEKLGKYKELLSPMFEHITAASKKLTIDDIDF